MVLPSADVVPLCDTCCPPLLLCLPEYPGDYLNKCVNKLMFGYRNGPKIVATVSATNKTLPTTASTLQILAIIFLRSSAASRSYEYAGAHTIKARHDTTSETMMVPPDESFCIVDNSVPCRFIHKRWVHFCYFVNCHL